MSLYEKCLNCGASEITLDELLKGLFQKDQEGNIGIEVKINVCNELNTPALACDLAEPTLADLLKMSMVIDECDKCSLKLFVDATTLRSFICDMIEECYRDQG
ncbi:MAG: hypothetical protein MUO78_02005 [candidate division Zixibacteria bacterium]|nr:hypothetical protein [candidate division Zixibacteria bacterium]